MQRSCSSSRSRSSNKLRQLQIMAKQPQIRTVGRQTLPQWVCQSQPPVACQLLMPERPHSPLCSCPHSCPLSILHLMHLMLQLLTLSQTQVLASCSSSISSLQWSASSSASGRGSRCLASQCLSWLATPSSACIVVSLPAVPSSLLHKVSWLACYQALQDATILLCGLTLVHAAGANPPVLWLVSGPSSNCSTDFQKIAFNEKY